LEYSLPASLVFHRFRKLVLCLMPLAFCLAAGPLSATTSSTTASQAAAVRGYVLWYRNYDSPAIRALVELALKKTPEYGEFQIIRSEELSPGRVLRELRDGQSRLVDMGNVAPSAEREKSLTAIPFPVDGGLLGFRVCVVMRESLPRVACIKTLDVLRDSQIRIG